MSLLPQTGTTRILATLTSATLLDLINTCNTLEELIRLSKPAQSQVLGIHLEGPYLNPNKAGTHEARALATINSTELDTLLSPSVKVMTLAPELEGREQLLSALRVKGVQALAGHTQATQADFDAAIPLGLSGITHLFNAMDGLHHRQPGTVTAALNDDRLVANLIADGEHVHPEVLRLTLKMKGLDKVCLTSDAMPLAGCPDGTQGRFCGQTVRREGQRALNESNGLAGSVQFLDAAIRNLVRWNLCSFPEAVQLATLNPAKLLGVEDQLGQIKPGAQADLVLWNKETLTIAATWVNGELAWCGDETLKQGIQAQQHGDQTDSSARRLEQAVLQPA